MVALAVIGWIIFIAWTATFVHAAAGIAGETKAAT
jgi:hypothetical protein